MKRGKFRLNDFKRNRGLFRQSWRGATLHQALYEGKAENLLHLCDLDRVDILLATRSLDGLTGAGFGILDGLQINLGFINRRFRDDRDLVGDDAHKALVDGEAGDLATTSPC